MPSPSKRFAQVTGRTPGRVHPFTQELASRPKPLDRAALYHYWHPDRDGVEQAPRDFAEKLAAIAGVDENGRPKALCVRPPAGAPVRCRCWLVFKREPAITHPLSPGWFLVLAWHDQQEPDPAPLPLDNRVLANLIVQSVKGGRDVYGRDFDNALQYYEHVMKVQDDDKARQEKSNNDYNKDRADDYYDYTKIKNIGHGSKFALHHDGTILPGRGEANWLRERGASVPGDVAARDKEEMFQSSRTTTVASADQTRFEHDSQWREVLRRTAIDKMRAEVRAMYPRKREMVSVK